MLLHSIVLIILMSASILRKDFSILLSRITLSSLLIVLWTNYNTIMLHILEKGITIYNNLYQCSSNTHIFNTFVILLTFFILTLTSYYPRKLPTYVSKSPINNDNIDVISDDEDESIYKKEDNYLISNHIIDKTSDQYRILEYSLLIMFVLSGAIFLMNSNDIISIFIGIELQSYGLYLLSSVYRNSESSTKAGLTYFLLGGLSSCLILLSQGILYVNSGITNLENIYVLSTIDIFNNQSNILFTENMPPLYEQHNLYNHFYINTSLIILSIGLLFKVSAAPFHFWSPDVYDGVPTIVTTFIAIIAKISIFILLLELVHYTNSITIEILTYNWSNNLLVSSLLSLIIGTVLGLTQARIKRLYAYSTISHVGFILLALSINTTESIQAFVFYLIQYSISNLNAFIILISVGYIYINHYNSSENKDKKNYNFEEKNLSPIQLISQIKGLYKINILLALSFSISLFSFLGVPPLLGFFGKQMVLSASLDNGYIFMSLVAILTSVISAVYYLVLIKHIYFDENTYGNLTLKREEVGEPNNVDVKIYDIKLSGNLTAMISIFTLMTFIYMFAAEEALNLTLLLSLMICKI